MKHSFARAALMNQYHYRAYRLYGRISTILSGIYVIHQSDDIAELQKIATIKAHTHRVKAEKAFL